MDSERKIWRVNRLAKSLKQDFRILQGTADLFYLKDQTQLV